MNKIELINFLKDNVNGKGDFDRDVTIVTGKKQAYKVFNLISYGKSKTKIGYYDDGFKIFSSLQVIDDLDEFIDTLDKKYNILYAMNVIDKNPHYYSNVELDNVMTLVEATEKWGLADSTLRKLMATDKLVAGIDYKKSGRATLITKRAMIKIYGDMPRK